VRCFVYCGRLLLPWAPHHPPDLWIPSRVAAAAAAAEVAAVPEQQEHRRMAPEETLWIHQSGIHRHISTLLCLILRQH
jgi:hypothetical protein